VLFHKYTMQHALLETPAHYVDFPWRPTNCIQETGMPDTIPAANAFYDVDHPVRRELHRLYIRRCLESLGSHTNVVHMVGEEYTGPLSFVEFWMDTIREWEAETGRDVLIALGAPKDVQDSILEDPVRGPAVDVLDLRYWWRKADGSLYAPPGGEELPGRGLESGSQQAEESSPEQIHRKIREYRDRYPDKAIIDALGPDRQQSWAFLMGGGSMIVAGQIEYPDHADPPGYIMPDKMDVILPTYNFIRERLATVLPRMKPLDGVVGAPDRNWCLGVPGEAYLIYALRGGTLDVTLPDGEGRLDAQWFDPRTGALSDAGEATGGETASLTAPDGQDWALWLRRPG
jgi:hypothetical protein